MEVGPLISSSIFKKKSGEVFYKKGILKYFATFTRKQQCQSLLFNKVAGLPPVAGSNFCLPSLPE